MSDKTEPEKKTIRQHSSLNIRVFISYQNKPPSAGEAETLVKRLEKEGFTTFYDKANLKGGDTWANKIYDNIRQSDVLIVLLQPQTAESDWVQREVDVARGANIAIMPVNLFIVDPEIDLANAQKKLAISEYQFHRYSSSGHAATTQAARNKKEIAALVASGREEAEVTAELKDEHIKNIKRAEEDSETQFEQLVLTLKMLAKKTRQDQADWWQKVCNLRVVKQARSKKSIKKFPITADKRCTIHLATGDITDLKEIDVIVNSENNYMQMARIFERQTLSSMLRQRGAETPHGRLLDDRVQTDLNLQIQDIYKTYGGLPVTLGEVIITPAGHPDSILMKKNKARYILHAATILFSPIERKEALMPVQTERGIINVIKNCLEKFDAINENKGEISNQTTKDTNFKPVTSIIFPIIATGASGRPIGEVIEPMLEACQEYVEDHEDSKLKDIYICVYAQQDVELVKEAMDVMEKKLEEASAAEALLSAASSD
jgi:O-acetyl-ADP-ribose deacetylase (regulator of RNase III)